MLRDDLKAAQIQAMKDKDKERLNALRLILGLASPRLAWQFYQRW